MIISTSSSAGVVHRPFAIVMPQRYCMTQILFGPIKVVPAGKGGDGNVDKD